MAERVQAVNNDVHRIFGADSTVSRFSSANCKGTVQYICRIGARQWHILSYYILLINRLLKTGTFNTKPKNEIQTITIANTQQLYEEAESPSNVSSSSAARSTQTQRLYPKCTQVATAFCTGS